MPATTSAYLVVANPAAAADWAYTVSPTQFPNGLIIVSVSALLTCSATVANRIPMLNVSGGANRVGIFGINAALTASQVARYVFGSGLPAAAAPVNSASAPSTFPLPVGLFVPAGGSIATVTAAIASGDQWSDIVLGVTT
jgi:hypothetical protein